MQRKRRKLYLILAIAALVAESGCILFWIRAYSVRDVLTLRINSRDIVWAEAVRHGFQFGLMRYDEGVSDIYGLSSGWSVEEAANPTPAKLHWGFGYSTGHFRLSNFTDRTYGCQLTFAVLPPAFVSFVCLIAFSIFGWAYWRTRKDAGFPIEPTPDPNPGKGSGKTGVN